MREIKFRAWNHVTKTMWWFNLLWGHFYHGDGWIGMVDSPDKKRTNEHGKDNRMQVDPDDCIMQQFTGLKDKNGKEIYEGDIVSNVCLTMRPDWLEKAEVKYNIGYPQFGGFVLSPIGSANSTNKLHYPHNGNPSNYEVIGNIYENPELIQEEDSE